ncbi:MAG: hypothetical protein HF981_24140 [Desulfobacteraceae bacterium]|nr:hypothetical protein [Desulfobacteraceae bacterium]MBC2753507.1 hypothetical protein [Desulfobacteraceae bacterium]
MKKRISKKKHKFWLELDVVDLSQNSYWRKKLFDAEENEPFDIDKNNIDHLPNNLIKEILEYDLKYQVAKVPSDETESWLSEGGLVIFKFWVKDFPSVKIYSGNNPDII